MCLAIPGKIEKIDKEGALNMARVDFGGVFKEICIEGTPEAKVGDYVVAHAGFAINLLDEEEALKNLETLRQIADSPEAFCEW